MTRDNENVNDEKDYKGPVHPKDTEDYAACAKWEEKFIKTPFPHRGFGVDGPYVRPVTPDRNELREP